MPALDPTSPTKATAAIFIAMNWGFSRALLVGSAVYVVAVAAMWMPAGRPTAR